MQELDIRDDRYDGGVFDSHSKYRKSLIEDALKKINNEVDASEKIYNCVVEFCNSHNLEYQYRYHDGELHISIYLQNIYLYIQSTNPDNDSYGSGILNYEIKGDFRHNGGDSSVVELRELFNDLVEEGEV